MTKTEWDEWKQQRLAKQEAEKAEQQREAEAKRAEAAKAPKVYTPVTDDERKILESLAGCSFGVGSPHKRFVRNMQGAGEMTQAQRDYVAALVHRYRRQLGLTEAGVKQWQNRLTGAK